MEEIILSNLSKKYSNQYVLRHVDFSFYPGNIVGILGDNGVGKTTLIKLICGLIYPDEGKIFINGIDIKKKRSKNMKNIGVFLEGSRSTYWKLTALQNFLYFAGLKGVFGNEAYIRAERVGIQMSDIRKKTG